MTGIKALLNNRAKVIADAKALLEKPTEEGRALTPEEKAEYDKLEAKARDLDGTIRIVNATLEADRNAPAVAVLEEPTTPTGAPSKFKSLGDFLIAVANAERRPGAVDPRLTASAAISGLGESIGADGGFLVDKDFSTEILRLSMSMANLAGRVRTVGIGPNSNGLKVNAIDETSRADGSRLGGVLAYWLGEAGDKVASKPKFRQIDMTLQKLVMVTYATDELLADATALASVVSSAAAEELAFQIDSAIFKGGGIGKPKGWLGASGTVVIAKEASQAAAGIIKDNVFKMYAAMPAGELPFAEWYIGQDCWPQLFGLNSGDTTLFIPPGGISAAPNGLLLGRPIVPIEHAPTMGTVGDISFCALRNYLLINKGGVESAVSMHVRFLNDEQVFRFVVRVNGQPIPIATIAPAGGGQAMSPFVTLATRP